MRRTSFDKLLGWIGTGLGVVLLTGRRPAAVGFRLRAQHRAGPAGRPAVDFPPAAAFAHPKAGTEITPSMIPSVSQYAGQQLVTGQQAEAYADGFIAVHIANMTGGQTYAQLSGKALAQPNNTKLQGQVATVFKGETLRSMLLNAYGWWKVSQITYIIALGASAWAPSPSSPGCSGSPASATTASWPPRRPRPSSRSARPASRPPLNRQPLAADSQRTENKEERASRRRDRTRRAVRVAALYPAALGLAGVVRVPGLLLNRMISHERGL